MIFGVGCDILKIVRIEKSIKSPRFLYRVFSEAELDFFREKNFAPSSIAANFCGKEAFAKALGTGVRGFSLKEVSVLRNHAGAPYLILEGRAKAIAEQKQLLFHITLSHSDDYAMAFVTAEQT